MITAFFIGLLVGIALIVALYYIKEEWVGFVPMLPLVPFMMLQIWTDFSFDRYKNWIIQMDRGRIIVSWNPMLRLRPNGSRDEMWVWLPDRLKEPGKTRLFRFLGFWIYIGKREKT